jgi:hypothetical protein
MKWFKHYSDASIDDKICRLEDDFGYVGYGVYWKIIEICALQWDGKSDPIFTINRKKMKSLLSINYIKIESILSLCSVLNLFSVEINDKFYTIRIDKLLNIKDNHTRNLQVTNKKVSTDLPLEQIRTDKNRTEYIYKAEISPDNIVQLWNTKMPEHEFEFCHGLGMGEHLKKFLEATNFLDTKEKWDELFTQCIESKALSGDNNIDWKVNLIWLVNYDNALKVLSGNYKSKNLADTINFNL